MSAADKRPKASPLIATASALTRLVAREERGFVISTMLTGSPPTASSGVGVPWLGFQQVSRDQDTPKRGEPGDEEAHVVTGGDEHGVDGVAGRAGEVITLKQTVTLGVADDRLDGVAPP